MPDSYKEINDRLSSLCEGENDPIAIMSTITCELFHSFDHFNWVGFYRNIGNETLKVGPYMGGHGCLTIPFSRGVCGQCAREKTLQYVEDVNAIAHHIACSSSTKSEIVLPVLDSKGQIYAVLDIDSDSSDAFSKEDKEQLPLILHILERALAQ